MSSFWGAVTITSGTRAYANIGSGGYSGVLIGNESGLSVVITLQGMNYSRSLYPGTVDWFPLTTNFNGNIQIDPSMQLSNATSWPGSYLQIDTFGLSEKPSGTYPVSLPRTNNVGNTVNTAGSTSTTMDFDNGKITSDGNGNITEQGSFSLSGLITSTLANPGLALSLLGKISIDNGNITTDGAGIITSKPYTAASGALKEFVIGNMKIIIMNNPATNNITFPIIVNSPWYYFGVSISGLSFKTGASAITVSRITSMGADGSFNTSANTTLGSSGFGFQTNTNCDNISGASGAFLIMIGN